eukprot:SAG25_NODE_2577_length_1520_cov_39.501759_2_plen_92_part_00
MRNFFPAVFPGASPLPSSPRAITTAASAAPSPPPPPPQSLSPPVEPNTQPVAELEGEGTWGLEVAQRVAEESRVELVCLVPDVCVDGGCPQ